MRRARRGLGFPPRAGCQALPDSREERIPLEIGPRLRTARRASKTSLRALARRTGFSASFLSQVELGQCSPSIASLQRICEALGTDLPHLLASRKASNTPGTRRAERETLRSEWSKATAQSLAPNGRELPYSALLVSIDAGGKTGQLHAPGGHFFAYCLRGRVRVLLHDLPHELAAGDSVAVDQPRAAWENAGRAKAEILIVGLR